MKDAYSFDVDDAGLEASYQRAARRLPADLRPARPRVRHRRRDVGRDGRLALARSSSRRRAIGEDTFVRSPGGYAANVEAVTTSVPDAGRRSTTPPPRTSRTRPTPRRSTRSSRVANARFARARPAVDRRRHAQERRARARAARRRARARSSSACPATARSTSSASRRPSRPPRSRPAGDADFAAHPELVKGYIGPGVARPDARSPTARADRRALPARPARRARAPAGSPARTSPAGTCSTWSPGRDFTADGTIEAAEVRAGDPAPDGSGPLELARGIEIGHIFALGRKYAAGARPDGARPRTARPSS